MKGRSIAILQSNYIPWKGTLDLIASVDEFVILDSVQFTKNDWRNRNRIQTPQGPRWLTIPIRTAGRMGQSIAAAEVADAGWAGRHWKSVAQTYARAPQFRQYAAELEQAYAQAEREIRLSRINRIFLELGLRWLRCGTRLTSSSQYPDHRDRVERLIGICRAAGAARYISGPRARAYLDVNRFAAAGIDVQFFEYPEYPKPHLSFLHEVLTS